MMTCDTAGWLTCEVERKRGTRLIAKREIVENLER